MTEKNKIEEMEVVQVSTMAALERASIDSQIATAKQYPRSMERFKKRAIDMATIDEETAESCLYRRPVGKDRDGTMKFAEGMSIRMAEIVGASYGNLRVQAEIVEQNERQVRARGTAIDLESNFGASSEVVESTVDRNGNPFSERMRAVVAKAALKKATRDATFSVVPKALAKPIEREVRSLLMGNSETLERRREKLLKWISKLGIDKQRVWAVLGIKGEAEVGGEQLETLLGISTSIKDDETTIDEAFPALGKDAAHTDDKKQKAKEEPKEIDEETKEKLVEAFGEYEGEVNIYLRDAGLVDADKTFRNIPPALAKRMLKNVKETLELAGVK